MACRWQRWLKCCQYCAGLVLDKYVWNSEMMFVWGGSAAGQNDDNELNLPDMCLWHLKGIMAPLWWWRRGDLNTRPAYPIRQTCATGTLETTRHYYAWPSLAFSHSWKMALIGNKCVKGVFFLWMTSFAFSRTLKIVQSNFQNRFVVLGSEMDKK